MEFRYEIKIPKERIAVLVGIKGSVKRKIEKKLLIKMQINSDEGDIILIGNDSFNLLKAQNIVKAIGRGFNPNTAVDLANENTALEIIDITEYSGDSKKRLEQVKARAIGTGGKTRKIVSNLTDTDVVIYGKTVGLIGSYEGVKVARLAFESLLSGSRHTTIYAWLEKEKKKSKGNIY